MSSGRGTAPRTVHGPHPGLTCFHELGLLEPECLARMWLARTCPSGLGGAPERYLAPGRAWICASERPSGASHVDCEVCAL